MFFVLSKTVGLLVSPFHLALALALLAGLLRLLRRARRLRRYLLIAAGIYLLLLSTGGVANLLLYPLETHHLRPAALPRGPGAIVLLGGMTSEPEKGPGYYELTDAADRLVEALRLAHHFPRALLVITGGSSALVDDAYREGDVLKRLVGELGLPPGRLRVDRKARNTRENALQARRILAGVRGPILLVTSALHMPRSVACFRKVGLEVIPWPVDYRRTGSGPGAWLPRPETLLRSRAALNEYAGLLAYSIAGYI